VYVSGVIYTHGILDWIRVKSASRIVAKFKGEYLILVTESAKGFRATIGVLRSLGEEECVSFHTFSFPEVRSVILF